MATTIRPTDAERWPPARLHRTGWWTGFAQQAVSRFGATMHRLWGAAAEGHFGILMYHRIADEVPGVPQPTINVTPARFRAQIEGLLSRGFVFWPLRKVLEFRQRGWRIMPWVTVLTFDDGFAGVYQHVLPVLREFHVPATVFLSTAYLDSRDPFPFDAWAVRYRSRLPAESFQALTHAQCDEMLASGLVDFGAHTHTHQDFRGRADEFHRDLSLNVQALRDRLDIRHPTFAFPYGTPHLGFASDELCEAARRAGVVCGLTTESALVRPGDEPFRWGRLHVFPWDTGATLAAKLSGWYSWAPRWKQRLFGRRPAPPAAPLQPALESGPAANEALCRGLPAPADASPRISIIVPTFNRAAWLGEALQSLAAQQFEDGARLPYEIVVVDNGSTDETARVVEQQAALSAVPILYAREPRPGDGAARNRGLEVATGTWLAFFDDDQLAEPGWLAALWKAARTTQALIVGGAVHLDLDDEQLDAIGPVCRRALRETRLYDEVRHYGPQHLPGTGNALVSRRVFHEIGPFDDSMVQGGSDCDFFTRAREAGWEMIYSPHAVIRHRVDPSRLSPDYLRWDALSGGAEHANYFDYDRRGPAALVVLCMARALHAVCVHVPLLAWAWLLKDGGGILGQRTRLWRTEGYVRKTLSLVAPRWFSQQQFFESLEFRNGRSVCR